MRVLNFNNTKPGLFQCCTFIKTLCLLLSSWFDHNPSADYHIVFYPEKKSFWKYHTQFSVSLFQTNFFVTSNVNTIDFNDICRLHRFQIWIDLSEILSFGKELITIRRFKVLPCHNLARKDLTNNDIQINGSI